ncbi:outer membrane beta-barrel protein [Bacteroides heparinolyticus]|uniref:outer membrane beta-barrel protein n=1 Tax=Prevotella heparinolytica TaxID=28113 RepID=UPI0023F6E44C|nr:outer membrane beta-barrel protein [Bacteroides heparinolyticus]
MKLFSRLPLRQMHKKIFIIGIMVWGLGLISAYSSVHGRAVSPPYSGIEKDSLFKEVLLDEVVIIGRRKLIDVRRDTTFINTHNLRVHKGAKLEDLVKKIPGMDFDKESRLLSFNGKRLNGVNINGQTFMGNDIAAALENLPADAIELLQLYNMLSEMEKMTGVSNGSEDFVLNIKTKNTYNGSLSGSLTAEHGNHGRRRDEAQANMFNTNGENISIIARSDNLGNMNALKGNFQNMLSGNIVKKIGRKMTLNGSVSVNSFHNVSESDDYDEQYLSSGTKHQESSSLVSGKNHNDFANFSMSYKIDEKTLLNVNANGSRGQTVSQTDNKTELYEKNSAILPLTSGMLQVSSTSKAANYNLSADFTRRLNKSGTSVSLTAAINGNSTRTESVSLSQTRYHRLKNTAGNDSLLVRNLYQETPSNQHNGHVSLLLTQPVDKRLRLQAGYGMLCRKTGNNLDSYDHIAQTKQRIDSLSNESKLTTTGQELTLRMDYKGKSWHITGGVVIELQRRDISRKNFSASIDTTVKATEYKPYFSAKRRKGKVSIEFKYNGNSTQPSIHSLLTSGDISNPLSIRIGNPHLKASYRQQFGVNLEENKTGLTLSGNFRNTFNDFAEEVLYNNKTGARTYRTVNIDGNWLAEGMLQWQKLLGKFLVSARARASIQNSVGLFNENAQTEATKSRTRTTGNNINLKCSYQPQWGYIELSGGWQTYRSHNLLTDTHLETSDYNIGISGSIELPYNIEARSDAGCYLRRGTYATSADDQWLWNLAVSWSFLKKKQAMLSFSWNDILNRRNNLIRSITAYNYHESYRPQIRSYVLLSLKYSFNLTRTRKNHPHK